MALLWLNPFLSLYCVAGSTLGALLYYVFAVRLRDMTALQVREAIVTLGSLALLSLLVFMMVPHYSVLHYASVLRPIDVPSRSLRYEGTARYLPDRSVWQVSQSIFINLSDETDRLLSGHELAFLETLIELRKAEQELLKISPPTTPNGQKRQSSSPPDETRAELLDREINEYKAKFLQTKKRRLVAIAKQLSEIEEYLAARGWKRGEPHAEYGERFEISTELEIEANWLWRHTISHFQVPDVPETRLTSGSRLVAVLPKHTFAESYPKPIRREVLLDEEKNEEVAIPVGEKGDVRIRLYHPLLRTWLGRLVVGIAEWGPIAWILSGFSAFFGAYICRRFVEPIGRWVVGEKEIKIDFGVLGEQWKTTSTDEIDSKNST